MQLLLFTTLWEKITPISKPFIHFYQLVDKVKKIKWKMNRNESFNLFSECCTANWLEHQPTVSVFPSGFSPWNSSDGWTWKDKFQLFHNILKQDGSDNQQYLKSINPRSSKIRTRVVVTTTFGLATFFLVFH